MPQSSLDHELSRMMRQARRAAQSRPIPRVAAPAQLESPQMEGIKFDGNRITVNGTTYTRDEFRIALEASIKAQREDPQSAYRNARDPNHKNAVEEINLAYRWLGGELTETDEREIVTEWHDATRESSDMSSSQPYQQIAEMYRDPEVRIAKQRRDAGAPLDDRQKEIMREYDRLESLNNSQARREAAGAGGWMSTKRPHYVDPRLYQLESIKDPRQKLHEIRAYRGEMRDNPMSAYNNVRDPNHKLAVEWMQRAYQAESELPKQPEDPE